MLEDWNALLALASDYGHSYSRNGVSEHLPEAQAIFATANDTHLLCVNLESVKVHCHFFVFGEIDLDIDPGAVVGQPEHLAVLLFLERLATTTAKQVRITAEGSRGEVLLSYDPAQAHWHG
jgi:hypothetical protein